MTVFVAICYEKKKDFGDDFFISQVVQFQVRRESPGIVFYKVDYKEDLKKNRYQPEDEANWSYTRPIRKK